MKKLLWVLVFSFTGLTAYASSALYDEFRRRENMRLTQEQGNAINFLKLLKYPVEKIEEFEMMDTSSFLIRDREGLVCLGDVNTKLLRCKNKIGLTTVSYDGDAD